jgi:magnesium-protoporphyrin IX monomethyl ester (oxidative) cyclase
MFPPPPRRLSPHPLPYLQSAADKITGPTRKIFIEFLERSCTAEFSGFLLYKELGRRLKKSNPTVAEIFTLMSRDEARHAGFINKAMSDFNLALDLGFLTKNRKYTFFRPKFIMCARAGVARRSGGRRCGGWFWTWLGCGRTHPPPAHPPPPWPLPTRSYATYLSEKIGYWRYISIYRHLQRNPDNQVRRRGVLSRTWRAAHMLRL